MERDIVASEDLSRILNASPQQEAVSHRYRFAMMKMPFILLLALVPFARGQQNPKPAAPIASLTAGYTYLYADEGNDYRSNLNGWFVKPQVTLGRGYSFFVDFTNYYGVNAKGSVNSHGITGGIQKGVFSRPKFKLSVFGEAGNVRASSAGTITNQLGINIGTNFTIPLKPWVSFGVTPAEYIFLYPNSDWRNDFNSKVGFSFPFGKR